jgi:hypothetical protein
VPLQANKLMDKSNFLALRAFEQLAGKRLTIAFNTDDKTVLYGKQRRAYRTIKNYLAVMGK